MKLLFWILVLPLLLLAAFFAVSNRESVSVNLWPISEPVQTQLWIVVAAPLYVGFFLGAIVAWASGHGTRARARAAVRRAETLQRDNANLQAQLDRLQGHPPRVPAVESREHDRTGAAPPAFLP
jgi:uncharacterized integral membrane protein